MSVPPPSPRWRRRRVVIALFCLLILGGLTAGVFYPSWVASRHWQNAQAALGRFDLTGACDHLRAYLATTPSSAEGHFLLARTLRRAEDYSAANQHLREAERLGWIPELIELERLLQQVQRSGTRGPPGELLKTFAEARHPEDKFILETLFKADRGTLNLNQATVWLNVWVERYPDDWLPRLWRGELLESFAHFDEARADFLRLLELKPDHTEALLRLGLIALYNRGNYAEAQSYLKQYLEKRPDHPEALLGLARCQKGVGELDAAAATVQRVLDKQPRHGEAAWLLGSIESDRGRPKEALRWLKLAEANGADPRNTAHQLSLVLRRLGKTEEAATYARTFEDLNEANRKLEKGLLAILKEPHNPALRHEIGTIYLRLGKQEKGVKWFLSALHEDPTYAPTHKALADYYEKKGDPQFLRQAAFHRLQAEKGKPSPPR